MNERSEMRRQSAGMPRRMVKLTCTWNALHRMYVCRDGLMRYADEVRALIAEGRKVTVSGGPLAS